MFGLEARRLDDVAIAFPAFAYDVDALPAFGYFLFTFSGVTGISNLRYWVNIGRPPVCTMSEVGRGSAVSDVSLLMTRSPLPTNRKVSPM